MQYQLAQLNISPMKAALDSPIMADFVANLDRINTLAESSVGFVWRLQTNDGNATALRPFGENILVNMSVWRDVETLSAYAYQSAHVGFVRRRKEWFERMPAASVVLWWVLAGSRPTLEKARERLEYLRQYGPSPWAFTAQHAFSAPDATAEITLRDVITSDLPIFFQHQQDSTANHMVAFTSADPTDRGAFDQHWAKVLSNESLTKQTILLGGHVIGNLVGYELFDVRNIGYCLGREYWGQGLATRALAEFLLHEVTRPLYARVAHDNHGSLRVLQKSGFEIIGEDSEFSFARKEDVREIVLQLR
jgi:RimJ/RimL family protein N-acetyltransferase